MDMNFLLKGLLIGFSIAAPVGVIGVLCIRRTLVEGQINGFVSGLGAATADAVYGSVAGFGLEAISNYLISHQTIIRSVGGGFLLYLGIRTMFSPTREIEEAPVEKGRSLLGAYLSTFLLTLTNPMTILSFLGIFIGLGIGVIGEKISSALQLVLGVFLGSALWWLVLSGFVGVFRRRLNQHAMRWINRISGTIILGFGVMVLWTIFHSIV